LITQTSITAPFPLFLIGVIFGAGLDALLSLSEGLFRTGRFSSSSFFENLLKKEDMYMKKSYCELEIYAERRYIAYSYSKHYIKALYWLLKYKYYKKRHEQQFNS
jgi:hypothetical protein